MEGLQECSISLNKPSNGACRTLTLETGKVARQADGAVLATYGETVVLATVVGAVSPREGVDFFPLTGELLRNVTTPPWQDSWAATSNASARLPNAKPSISRLIDRADPSALRREGYRNETQVVVRRFSAMSMENDPDIVESGLRLLGGPDDFRRAVHGAHRRCPRRFQH